MVPGLLLDTTPSITEDGIQEVAQRGVSSTVSSRANLTLAKNGDVNVTGDRATFYFCPSIMAGIGNQTQLQIRDGANQLKDGMRRFLDMLPEDVIFSLLKTTTGGLVSTSDVNEARVCIVRYAEPASLLGRRKVKLEYIVKFLHAENVPMKLPSDKTTLTHLLLNHWNLNEQGQVSTGNHAQPAHHSQSPPQYQPTSSYNQTGQQDSLYADVPPPAGTQVAKYDETISQELGLKFTKWFYTMLNTLNEFEAKHFWDTCSLRVEAVSANPLIQEVINNGHECCQLLRSLVETEKIVFTPNLINNLGVTCVINTFGLAQVKVAGTVQVVKPGFGSPGGVFEQVFGLMKDPMAEENYKIKFSVLRLRAATNAIEYTELSNVIMNTPVVIEEVNDSD